MKQASSGVFSRHRQLYFCIEDIKRIEYESALSAGKYSRPPSCFVVRVKCPCSLTCESRLNNGTPSEL